MTLFVTESANATN